MLHFGPIKRRNVMVVDAIIISLSGRILLRTTERWGWWDAIGVVELNMESLDLPTLHIPDAPK